MFCAALERVALRGCRHVSTAGIYVLLQRPGLKRVVLSKCPQINLESSGGPHLKVGRGAGAAACDCGAWASIGLGAAPAMLLTRRSCMPCSPVAVHASDSHVSC